MTRKIDIDKLPEYNNNEFGINQTNPFHFPYEIPMNVLLSEENLIRSKKDSEYYYEVLEVILSYCRDYYGGMGSMLYRIMSYPGSISFLDLAEIEAASKDIVNNQNFNKFFKECENDISRMYAMENSLYPILLRR